MGAGLCSFENGRRIHAFTKEQGLAGNDVYALAVEDDGSLWVGTNGGLNHLQDGRVDRTYTTAEGLPENRVQFLSRDRTGVLWIGTSASMASYPENGRCRRCRPRSGHGTGVQRRRKMMEELRHIPIIADVSSDQKDRGLQRMVTYDRKTAARFNILAQLIDNTLYDAFGQRPVATMYTSLNQYFVVMEVAPRF
jgi:ligand-binding sensor domain-containing protein